MSAANARLTFLHTSASHIARFDAVLAELDSSVTARHFVREALLTEARTLGVSDAGVQRQLREVLASLARTSPVMLCTCSTLGAALGRGCSGWTDRWPGR